jgi:hypothetical protein
VENENFAEGATLKKFEYKPKRLYWIPAEPL